MKVYFKFAERGANLRTELLPGLAAFPTMTGIPLACNISHGISFAVSGNKRDNANFSGTK